MDIFFRHYKNAYYQLVGEALDTRDDSLVVVYRTLYPSQYLLFTRPREEFYGWVTLADGTSCRRFTPVGREALPAAARAAVVEALTVPLAEERGEP